MFIDGTATEELRTSIVRHLATCHACQDLVGETVRLEGVRSPRRFNRAAIVIGGSLALAASLFLAVRMIGWRPFGPATPIHELVLAVGTERTVEGRLSGGFEYGPSRSARRGTETNPNAWRLLAVAGKIRSDAERDPSPANRHALGVAHLVLGDYDTAVNTLEDAAARADDAAVVRSDLSAAYATRAARRGDVADFTRALEAARQALNEEPQLAEALFNLAVALEGLGMVDEARSAWEAYLRRDPDGGWAGEARARLASKSGQASLDDASPLASRDAFFDELLPRWADAVLQGGDAAPLFAEAREIATEFGRQSADRLAAATIDAIAAAPSPAERRSLAALHRCFGMARSLQRDERVKDASTSHQRCTAGAPAAHPVRLLSAFHATQADVNDGKGDVVRPVLVDLAAQARQSGFFELLSRIEGRLGLIDALRGDLPRALAHYQASADAAAESGIADSMATAAFMMAESERLIGDLEGSWRRIVPALERTARLRNPRLRHSVLVQGVLSALAADAPEAALVMADALVKSNAAWGHAANLTLARSHRARALHRLGRVREALAELDEARHANASVKDESLQRRFDTEFLLAEVDVRGLQAPDDAIRAVDRALEHIEFLKADVRLPGLFFARAGAQLRAGNIARAESDFRTALAELDKSHGYVADSPAGIAHLERNFGLVRAFAEFQLGVRRDATQALASLERARSRWLLTRVRGVDARSIDPAILPAAVPDGTAAVVYGVLGGAMHAWVVTNGGIVHRPLATPLVDIERRVERLWSVFQERRPEGRRLLTELHADLLAPLADAIGERRRLLFVPDGPIFNVPLAALVDGRTDRYLIQDAVVEISPSLTLARIGDRPGKRAAVQTSVGIFGGNAPGYEFLSRLASEQAVVASLYAPTSARRYSGDGREFLRNADRHDIVHFAGHAVPNAQDPASSRLAFPAANGVQSGDIFARDIAALRLRRVQVVVLAACRTAWGRNAAGEGSLSLAHAFLGAGAGSVLASLWDVDDRATGQLLTMLHEGIADGRSLTDALREAQLRALSGTDATLREPAEWAAFVASVRG